MKIYSVALAIAALVVAVLSGIGWTDQRALAQALTSPHLADLKRPDTGPMRKYVADAMDSVSRLRNTYFANQDTNRDVMHDLADGTKSYVNQAKLAAEACDRAAYDAAIAKINAWADTLDGLIADAEKTMKGISGPGSIDITMDEVTKPFDARAKALRRRRAAAQERLDAAAKAAGIGPAILRRMGDKPLSEVAGPYNEVKGFDKALAELGQITSELDSLARDYRENYEFGEKVIKALNDWKAKLQAARAGIPVFPEDCGRTADTDTRIGLGGSQTATDTNGVALNGQAPSPVGPSWLFGTPVYVGNLDRASTGLFGTEDNATNTINSGNLLFLTNDELFFLYGLDLIHRFWFGESVWDIRFGFSYGDSDGDQMIDRVSPGNGNDLLIFGPQGPTGLTGGGLNAGPRDAVNINHTNDNEFHEFRGGLFGNLFTGPAMAIRGGVLASYGRWDLTERIWGGVDGINQTFMYYNMAEVSTYSLGAGLEVEHDVGTVFDTPVKFKGGLSFEKQFHDKDGHSTLILDGLVNATERQELGGDEETNKFSVNAGVTFKLTERLNLDIGAKYDSFSTPRVDIQPQQVADIELDDSDALAVFARMVVGLGPEVHESPILNPGVYSDRRLKRDIRPVATLDNGIKLYSFRYLWSDLVHVGVMAQDLLADEAFRDAVVLGPNGFYAVDYARLGLRMATLEAWRDDGLAAVMTRPAVGKTSASLTLPLQ